MYLISPSQIGQQKKAGNEGEMSVKKRVKAGFQWWFPGKDVFIDTPPPQLRHETENLNWLKGAQI